MKDDASSKKTATHASVKHLYEGYAQRGGDGTSVWTDRAVSLGYEAEFLRETCGFSNEEGDVAGILFSASCGPGCPLRLPGHPQSGETVVDLGCGAGHDVILASRMVGTSGRVIGVDLTTEMIQKAKTNAQFVTRDVNDPVNNIQFIEGAIDDSMNWISQLKGTADVVMSNGVFNLCHDKQAAFQTAFDLLAPGGRLLLSDLCRVDQNPGAALATCSVCSS